MTTDKWDMNPFTAAIGWLIGAGLPPEPELADYVEDPDALEAAEAAVAQQDRYVAPEQIDDSTWVVVWGPGYIEPTTGGFELTGVLQATGIRFAWQPFDPADQSPSVGHRMRAHRFELWVPPQHAQTASGLIAGTIKPDDLIEQCDPDCGGGSCDCHVLQRPQA